MRKEISIEETGKTVEEALDKACKKLGVKRDECTFEIIDRPRKRLFGLRFTPAKVRVSIEVPEDIEVKVPAATPKRQDTVASPPKQETTPKKAHGQQRTESKATQKTAAPVGKRPVIAKPATREPAREAVREPAPPVARAPKTEAPRVEVTTEVSLEVNPEKVIIATQFVTDMVKGMGIEAAMGVRETADGIFIAIDGNDLGTIIGRRGETLDAIQYLTGLVTNRLEGEYLRVTVDSGDYRLKREQTLVELAERLSEQVLKTNVSKTLEPMSASERRVIHATVAEIEGVSSHSVGSDPGRRVVIKSPTSTSRSSRRSSGSSSGPRRNTNRRPSNDSRESVEPMRERVEEIVEPAPVAPKETATPNIVKDTPLYGKVDLE